MACTPAPCCKSALAEATKLWPNRSKVSDGICASPKHSQQNPTSDHELGNAFDLTHDPAHGVDTYLLAELMRLHPDPRVKYVISNGRIWNPSISPNWRTYTGSNRHDHHMHVSIHASARGASASWFRHLIAPADTQGDAEMTADEREAVLTANHFVKVIWPDYATKIDQIHQHLEVLMKGVPALKIPPTPRLVQEIAEKHGIDV